MPLVLLLRSEGVDCVEVVLQVGLQLDGSLCGDDADRLNIRPLQRRRSVPARACRSVDPSVAGGSKGGSACYSMLCTCPVRSGLATS